VTDQDSVGVYVDRLLAEAPPLTPEQQDRLAVLLKLPVVDSTGGCDAA